MSKAAAEAKALEKVQAYMLDQNRPYSVNDVFMNLHKEFGKTVVLKTLDTLVESSVLKEKQVSKQKIYYANQDGYSVPSEAELALLDKQAQTLETERRQLVEKVKAQEAKLKTLSDMPTYDQLCAKLESLKAEIQSNNKKLATAKAKQEDAPLVSKQEREKMEKQFEAMQKEAKKRKRMAKDMLDAIMENCPKKKKDLFEEIGIEDDPPDQK